ncbi:MAG: PKD domain-containing protein [Candidatus Thermoplasmatota archaeon]|nr:PKD domain-containing protein [Candidatus Thermoplasmatota archaeon]MBS3801799.1 PKD domain-containing protein [Candidatus Thermoplasmatota archaeon]
MLKRNKSSLAVLFVTLTTIFLLCSSTTLVACSGFTIKKDDQVIIAHNKDWHNPQTTMYFYPAKEGSYARLFFEIPFPHIFNRDYKVLAGGINEHGLCYESFVTPFNPASFELFKPPLFKNPVDYLLQQCTTVEEVVLYIESHNLFFLNYILSFGQLFVVDKTGDAAIIEGDDIIRIQKDYQACTNFLQSNPSLGNYPCWRYEAIIESLENASTISNSFVKSLLESVQLYAQYSWILNPSELSLELYHFHDFEQGIHINLTEEFNQPAHSYFLPSLFEPANNTAPNKPHVPVGPLTGTVNNAYLFETNTTDADNHPSEIYYQWDFGDGTQTTWIYTYQPYRGSRTHQWKKPGTYQIRVKAKDIYGKESPWSDPFCIEITPKQNLGSYFFR